MPDRTCFVGRNTLIGSHTTIGEGASVVASVVGQHCRIGARATVCNSYLFDGAVVGAGCTVDRSILGAGAHVKDGSRVPRGCLIGEGVVLGPDAVLQPFERLSARRSAEEVAAAAEDDDSDIEEVESSEYGPQMRSGFCSIVLLQTRTQSRKMDWARTLTR